MGAATGTPLFCATGQHRFVGRHCGVRRHLISNNLEIHFYPRGP